MTLTGRSRVAGVAGWPVAHSLSPLLHNAWIAAAGLDAVYVPFRVAPDRFAAFVTGLRGGGVAGLNVTLPFKGEALALADSAAPRARRAQAANVLVFQPDGSIFADNTDGQGLLAAFAEQAPGLDLAGAAVAVLGAGGAALGALAALADAGCRDLRVVNRTLSRAEAAADAFGARAYGLDGAARAFDGAGVLINASSAELTGGPLDLPLDRLPRSAVVMDMTYKPLITPLLTRAQAQGLATVDGLAMLIGQAVPAFEAFFGRPAPAETPVRALALASLET